MSILRNGSTAKYKIFHNGEKMKKALHNNETVLWKDGNLVTYHVDTNEVYTEEVDSDETCLEPKTFSPTKEDFDFLGWKEDTVADRNVIEELNMGDDPVTLYAVFEDPVCLYYDGNEADDKYYSWQHIPKNYRDDKQSLMIVEKNGAKALNFSYLRSIKAELTARLSLNNPITLSNNVNDKTNYIVVEIDFEVEQPYADKATGFNFYISEHIGATYNGSASYGSFIRFCLEQYSLYRYTDNSNTKTKVKVADFKSTRNSLKIFVNRFNRYCSYYLNGQCVESNLPPYHTWVTDVGVLCIHTPAETGNNIKNLFLYSMRVYEHNVEDLGFCPVNEDYSKYDVETNIYSCINAGGMFHNKYIYYNNGNVANPNFTLIDNFFNKKGYHFGGWSKGEIGKSLTLTEDSIAYAKWNYNPITDDLQVTGYPNNSPNYLYSFYSTPYDLTEVKSITITYDYYYRDANSENGASQNKYFYNAFDFSVGISLNREVLANSDTFSYGAETAQNELSGSRTATINVSDVVGSYYIGASVRGYNSNGQGGMSQYYNDGNNKYYTKITNVIFNY